MKKKAVLGAMGINDLWMLATIRESKSQPTSAIPLMIVTKATEKWAKAFSRLQ